MNETREPGCNVVLKGGPELNPTERLRYAADLDAPIKVSLGNRYEHFEPSAERETHDGRQLRVFTWTHRTYVAE